MTPDEIAAVADRLTDETVEDRRDDWLAFVDRFGVRWQITDRAQFAGAGTSRGLWLDVPAPS